MKLSKGKPCSLQIIPYSEFCVRGHLKNAEAYNYANLPTISFKFVTVMEIMKVKRCSMSS